MDTSSSAPSGRTVGPPVYTGLKIDDATKDYVSAAIGRMEAESKATSARWPQTAPSARYTQKHMTDIDQTKEELYLQLARMRSRVHRITKRWSVVTDPTTVTSTARTALAVMSQEVENLREKEGVSDPPAAIELYRLTANTQAYLRASLDRKEWESRLKSLQDTLDGVNDDNSIRNMLARVQSYAVASTADSRCLPLRLADPSDA